MVGQELGWPHAETIAQYWTAPLGHLGVVTWDKWAIRVLGATLGSAMAAASLCLSRPLFAHLWSEVSSGFSAPGTFWGLCPKGAHTGTG